ncbi:MULTISPECIES: DUF1403 family protein [unclassified Marinovum]|uniref:DUF1403 family protein n=1 Tax=unclassified Marinovum TaxID=2647166 RepID=UPI003EDB7B28
MTFARPDHSIDPDMIPRMPGWVISARAETLEDVAFLSGAALSHLHLVLGREDVPHALLRDRLALRAAEACVAFSGRPERAGELRDAVHLLRPGDLPGPAGETCLAWRRAGERPVSIKALGRALPSFEPGLMAGWLDAGQGGPVTRAAMVLETVLTDAPRADVAGLILADAALAQALGWDHVLPLLATGLKRADLRKRGDDLRLACHRALVASAVEAVRLAADLSRRAAHLQTVAPKLRAKGAGEAVAMFLTRDAVAPSALPLPDRAARRLCDRLVDLGAVRELTGRDTFRLYGV